MMINTYTILSTSWELYKGKGCKVSKCIAALEELEAGLRKLLKVKQCLHVC